MRIGLTGAGSSVEAIAELTVTSEAAGFSSLWFSTSVAGDPLVAMAMAGRGTSRIELGTGVLNLYSCHPVLTARRAAAAAAGMGRAGFTLGLGPSHAAVVGRLGLSYDRPGRYTEEYLRVVTAVLQGGDVEFDGDDFHVRFEAGPPADPPVPVLLAAMSPRLLRVAGEVVDGTIAWMANARAIETHLAPRITAAAANAGRNPPRIVVGLPVAVHDDVDEAREKAGTTFSRYAGVPNYQRIIERGGVSSPAEAAIIGDEQSVTAQLQSLFDAGATDVWANVFTVGEDRAASRARTNALLSSLTDER
jgi:F420-dependent oxidoreductase-like protein